MCEVVRPQSSSCPSTMKIQRQLWADNLEWKTVTIQKNPAMSFAFCVMFAAVYAVIVILCGLYYCSLPPSPDQSVFDYIAWQGLHGVQWYAGSFEITWPG